MNVYVVGAGAIGRYLGEALRRAGASVAYAPRALEAVEPVTADLAIVAVKAYDTPGAVATLRRALAATSAAAIVTPQNGVGNEELLAAAFGADAVVAAALTVPVDLDAAGNPVASNRGGIGLAPVGAASACRAAAAAFAGAGIPVATLSDYRALKWSKLALNVVANAACAILDLLPAQLVTAPGALALELYGLREVHAVMRALGLAPLDLPRYPVRALLAAAALPVPLARALVGGRIARARGTKPPSLLLDLRAGKDRTEVDVLNGAVARAARTAGVAAPVNTVYARLVAELSRAPALRERYRARPDLLAADVAAEAGR